MVETQSYGQPGARRVVPAWRGLFKAWFRPAWPVPAWSTSTRKFSAWLVALWVAISGVPSAAAYSTPSAFGEKPMEGGGGGRFFTGSPADGYECSECHFKDQGPDYPLYVNGLPLEGYGPNIRREVVLSWPEFAGHWRELRPDPTQPTDKDDLLPAMGLLAEFVAETGQASGSIELNIEEALDAGRCERTRPNLEPRVAASMYQVRPGLEPLRLRPDRSGLLRCEARQLGQRCIIAMDSCGAEELRFVWTSPDTQAGPIWFAAGFVAADVLSGSYDQDAVSMVAVPLQPEAAPEAEYIREVQGGCSSAGPYRRPPGWLLLTGLTTLCLMGWRASGRRRVARGGR